MKTNIIIDISPPYLTKFWVWVKMLPANQIVWFFNHTRKKVNVNFVFGMQIKIDVFYKLMQSFSGVFNQACPKYAK